LKRLIISDTHIGSKFYKKEELLRLLQTKTYDQLILNGDIIDFLKGPTFTTTALDILRAIDPSKEIIYVVGNHDTAVSELIDQTFLNIKFVKEYCFEDTGRKFRVEHGDKYETGLVHKRYVMKIISIFQDIIERTSGLDLSTWLTNLKLKKRKLKRLWDILEDNDDVDALIVGHTHLPEVLIWIDENEKIKTYVNTGDWVQHATYVEIVDGVIRLKNFLKE
jgi:UDP-2,3-diacylglucosamine pyrophosphatase LpxH|tara:strand:- start:740 stop:1402 length:663 start_codon:yes stop_codon:yes gene_type:complete